MGGQPSRGHHLPRGTFHVQNGIDRDFGFGIYTGTPTTWTDADGYLPAQVTTFRHAGAIVSITEFADKLILGGDAYVAVYSRVAVSELDQPRRRGKSGAPPPGWCRSTATPDVVKPHASVEHDYVVAVDRFGNDYPWPSTQALATAGDFSEHFAHMRTSGISNWLVSPESGSPTPRSMTHTGAGSSTPRSPGVATT